MMNKVAISILLLLTILAPQHIQAEQDVFRSQDSAYSVFLLLKSERAWLDLNVPERFEYLETTIQPILEAHPAVSMKFWDTEHFNARISDVLLLETQALDQYQSVIERLRETRFWDDYFQVVEILPGIENAYADYYERPPVNDRTE